jgi:hypothetical protein
LLSLSIPPPGKGGGIDISLRVHRVENPTPVFPHCLYYTVAIADKTFAITQKGAVCTITALTPSSQPVPVAGGTAYSFNLTVSPQDCAWKAASNESWITVTSGSDTGSGTVTYNVPANTTNRNQTGTIAVTLTKNAKKKVHTVTQGEK